MEVFVIFKYLHVVSMFFAVALAVSTELVLRRIAQSGEVAAIRVAVARVKPFANLASAFFVGGVAFGIIAALAGQIDLLRPWLVLSYVAFAGALVIGFTTTDPWVGRLERAVAADGDGGSSETLEAVIADPRARAGTWALMALIAAIVFLMVVKPLG